jgi:hypothetical protein
MVSGFGAARLHAGGGKRDTMGHRTKLPEEAIATTRALPTEDQLAVAMLSMAEETRGPR